MDAQPEHLQMGGRAPPRKGTMSVFVWSLHAHSPRPAPKALRPSDRRVLSSQTPRPLASECATRTRARHPRRCGLGSRFRPPAPLAAHCLQAEIVRLMRQSDRDMVTLAIGDGANDVRSSPVIPLPTEHQLTCSSYGNDKGMYFSLLCRC